MPAEDLSFDHPALDKGAERLRLTEASSARGDEGLEPIAPNGRSSILFGKCRREGEGGGVYALLFLFQTRSTSYDGADGHRRSQTITGVVRNHGRSD